MQAKKHWILAALTAAAALTCGLSCRGLMPPAKKRSHAQPISASVQARHYQSQIAFKLQFQDANGKQVSGIVLPSGKRPPAPKVSIVDDEGNDVYTFSMRYG
jgi:hypothetical protein